MAQTAPFPHLFSPLDLGRHRLRNRICVTGHATMMTSESLPNDDQVAYYEARAKGGAGLIVVEGASVHASGLRGPTMIDAGSDRCIPAYAKIVAACGEQGVPVIGQLLAAGREMSKRGDGTRFVAYGPSVVPSERHKVMPRALTGAMIAEIVKGHGDAARRLQSAGCAGSEVFATMGYLQASFLNPRTNRRSDAYGGSFEKRLRFLEETLADIRDKCGADHLLGVRLSLEEMSHDGISSELGLEICSALAADGGIDYIGLAGGSSTDAAGSIHMVPPMSFEPAYLGDLAGRFKQAIDLPVMLAGRINQPHEAEKILTNGWADLCGMTRALICDPDLPVKAEAGRVDDIRACIGCNQACIGHEQAGQPISCIQRPETGRERRYGRIVRTDKAKRVYVAGGGPAGLKAATVAALRGHDVTLFESGPQPGGQVVLAQCLPGRAEFGGLITNLLHEAKAAGVTFRLNCALERETVERDAPDSVILATGARPYRPELEIDEAARVFDAWDVLTGKPDLGASVLIADWRADWIGLGLAERLAREGCRVTLAVAGPIPGESIQQYVRDHWAGIIHRLGVRVVTYARLFGVDADAVYLQHTASGEAILESDVDSVVLALGHAPDCRLEQAMAGWQGGILLAGDCLSPRTVEEAVLEGLQAAWVV